jgi:glycosyltransferase involved in cell wall biosynthesis
VKVALIVPGGVDRIGERRVIPAVLWLIERLARECELHVFALYQDLRSTRYQLLGATVHSAGRAWARARTFGAILAEHRRRPFTLLHAFWATPAGVLAVGAGKLLRRPVLLHLAGGELVALPEIGYGGFRGRRGRFWVRLALRGADRVSAASGSMIDRAAQLGVRPERLPLGVDLVRWPVREPRARGNARPAKLLHSATLNRVKDQQMLLRAAAALVRADQSFHLDLAGEDTLGGELQRLARALGVSRWITFHGFLTQRELRPLVESADLFLLSSRHEAGPVAVREAAVAGVPTVGTAVGHVKDWAPRAAVALPIGDHEALARETIAVLAEDARRLALARAAQDLAVREDADWTARRVLELYRELSAPRGAIA